MRVIKQIYIFFAAAIDYTTLRKLKTQFSILHSFDLVLLSFRSFNLLHTHTHTLTSAHNYCYFRGAVQAKEEAEEGARQGDTRYCPAIERGKKNKRSKKERRANLQPLAFQTICVCCRPLVLFLSFYGCRFFVSPPLCFPFFDAICYTIRKCVWCNIKKDFQTIEHCSSRCIVGFQLQTFSIIANCKMKDV